jgi:hypothetical protein
MVEREIDKKRGKQAAAISHTEGEPDQELSGCSSCKQRRCEGRVA